MEAQRRPPHFNRKQHLGHQVGSVQLQHPHQEHLELLQHFKRVQLTYHSAEEASAQQLELEHSVNQPRQDLAVSRPQVLLGLLLVLDSGLHLGLDNLRPLGLVLQQPAHSDSPPPVHSELHQPERSVPLLPQASAHHRVVSDSLALDSEPPPRPLPLVSPQRQLHLSAPRLPQPSALPLLVPSALPLQGHSVHQLVQVLVSLLGHLELRQRPRSALLQADSERPLASAPLNSNRYSIIIYY